MLINYLFFPLYIAIVCISFSDVVNGEITYDPIINGDGDFVFGTVATLTCDTSFIAVGPTSSTCGANGGLVEGAFEPAALGTCDSKPPLCNKCIHFSGVLVLYNYVIMSVCYSYNKIYA